MCPLKTEVLSLAAQTRWSDLVSIRCWILSNWYRVGPSRNTSVADDQLTDCLDLPSAIMTLVSSPYPPLSLKLMAAIDERSFFSSGRELPTEPSGNAKVRARFLAVLAESAAFFPRSSGGRLFSHSTFTLRSTVTVIDQARPRSLKKIRRRGEDRSSLVTCQAYRGLDYPAFPKDVPEHSRAVAHALPGTS